MIHVFLGTKAQYIKTAPLLWLLDAQQVPYRLIDSGQHAALSVGLREELGVRAPDHLLAEGRDITRIPQAALWAAKLAAKLVGGRRLRREVFAGRGGVCVVHGDTPSTLLAALMAKRAGLTVAHLEAGLRSRHVLHPFPEELIRRVVMRLSDLLFAPDEVAVANLRRMRIRGEVVRLPGNTVVEALHRELGGAGGVTGAGGATGAGPGRGGADAGGAAEVGAGGEAGAGSGRGRGPVVVTMHRVENLNRRERVEQLVGLVERVAREHQVRFVQHGPTIDTLRRNGWGERLRGAGVELVGLAPHGTFVAMLRDAPFVVTDGGSIQEECALLGVPTLLWRAATERPDGVGANVVVSRYDRATIEGFFADPEAFRRHPADTDATPSQVVLERLRPFV